MSKLDTSLAICGQIELTVLIYSIEYVVCPAMQNFESIRNKEVPKIDLMTKDRLPKAPVLVNSMANTVPAPYSPPATGMTMEHLQNNYEAIVNARAIFYPVAYQFLKELGRGRQGRVFLGLRQGARGCITEQAIKVFDPRIYRNTEEYWTDMGRIAFQISKLQRLQSPNLVAMSSYEETCGIGYVQLEAIDGIDLGHLLSREYLDLAKKKSSPKELAKVTKTIFRIKGDKICLQPGVAVYILRGVLRGLERLHSINFLHSDIKPENIMIDRLGNVKVVDFGRAVMVGEKVSFLMGSPLYMAPELHRREIGGMQSDFYSVGLVALEMLRGEKIAHNDDVNESDLLNIKMNLLDRLEELLPPHVLDNSDLVAILRRFIEPDPIERYSSAQEADVGEGGLRVIDRQLVQAGLASEYGRDLSEYLSKLVNENTQRIELDFEQI
ncbi:MAG: serine/threonine-protein kinase [Kiritimatiellae bacterium]|nr:serine/threonine-protein kinase [Kiritimatiellia bacterium]MDD5520292.1 serine/threonine-protein kinase [Kiritimatiellia bacterium]